MINGERVRRDIIVIGGSAGGVQPVMTILEALPGNLPAAIGVVLHRSPFHETQLPFVLGRHSPLSVLEPVDGAVVQPGVVYVAPRDQHMLLEDGVVRVGDRGPKQHRTRPSIGSAVLLGGGDVRPAGRGRAAVGPGRRRRQRLPRDQGGRRHHARAGA